MRNISILILCLCFCGTVVAQDKKGTSYETAKAYDAPDSLACKARMQSYENEKYNDSISTDDSRYLNGMVPVGSLKCKLPEQDTLHLPKLDNYGGVYSYNSWRYPYFGTFGPWDIHEGLNVQLGLTAFSSFRKGGFNGWGQNISAIYAKDLNAHLSLAVGGYFNNYSTSYGPLRSVGLTAVLNYRFNEHWEAFVYGQKSLMENRSAYFSMFGPYGYGPYGYSPMYDMGQFGDKIGAGVTWHPTQNTSVQVQFEYKSDPHKSFNKSIEERWEMPR